MKKTVMVVLVVLMAAIGSQMTVAAPAARQYTLVQVPVIELDRIDGPGGACAVEFLSARIRAAVAKSGKAVVSISGNQFADVAATQDRVTASGRYATPNRKWAEPGQMIAPTNHFSVTGETGYYEEDGGRQIAGAVVSAVVTSALARKSSSHSSVRGPATHSSYRGSIGNSGYSAIDWRKKSAYVDLTLEAPSTATGLYNEFGSVHARGTASLEDVNVNTSNFGGGLRGPTAYGNRSGSNGNETKLFQKAADRALQQLISGLPEPEVIGPITVKSGKSLVAGKTKIVFFRDGNPIASYQVLAVADNSISVYPLTEVSRPGQGDSFDIVQ
jgi:hypothetical protein